MGFGAPTSLRRGENIKKGTIDGSMGRSDAISGEVSGVCACVRTRTPTHSASLKQAFDRPIDP